MFVKKKERKSENLSHPPIPNSSFIPQGPFLTAGYMSFQNLCNVPQTAYQHIPEVCFYCLSLKKSLPSPNNVYGMVYFVKLSQMLDIKNTFYPY